MIQKKTTASTFFLQNRTNTVLSIKRPKAFQLKVYWASEASQWAADSGIDGDKQTLRSFVDTELWRNFFKHYIGDIIGNEGINIRAIV